MKKTQNHIRFVKYLDGTSETQAAYYNYTPDIFAHSELNKSIIINFWTPEASKKKSKCQLVLKREKERGRMEVTFKLERPSGRHG
ncbi:hypothetical protein WA026_012598 [Henosepilachna vigintioctopunctata]|uniref:Uncharacterized protein n=1 Tax=Henosepilachna vigintioctopunctata TaxID=420089 RepID=A0AAW1U5U0_9CUCU